MLFSFILFGKETFKKSINNFYCYNSLEQKTYSNNIYKDSLTALASVFSVNG